MIKYIGKIRSLRKDRDGMALVEFALILTPLLMILMGGLDLGYQSYVRSVLQGALNEVSRDAVVQYPNIQGVGDTPEEKIDNAIEARVNEVAADGGSYTIEKQSFQDFSNIGQPESLMTDHNGNGAYDDGDCWEDMNENGQYDANGGTDGLGGASDVVFYNVTLTMPRLLPVMSLIGVPDHYTITAQTAIRNQPFDQQRPPPIICGD